MAIGLVSNLQNLWPFSFFKHDDLRTSKDLVSRLSIPEHAKEFVFAIREPGSQSVIYILSAQNLSQRSALDAECLIRELRPDAVVAQVGNLTEIQCEESELGENVDDSVPTSLFGVLKRCFVDKINKEKYENVAGNLVLREIFGISFHGHLFAAKRAAQEVGSSFMVLESRLVRNSVEDDPSGEFDVNKVRGLASSLVPLKVGSVVSSSSKRSCTTNDAQSQMVKLFSLNLDLLGLRLRPPGSSLDMGSKEVQPRGSYQVPSFAQSVYPLLVDLHDIFVDLPSMSRALAFAQKMLYDVNRGEVVESQVISEVYTFRIAVEGLRIALNNAGRLPINKLRNPNSINVNFSELPLEDKSHALLAQTLQGQAKKFKTVVAVVDASCLAGLRKHWNTPLPDEVKDFVGQFVTSSEDDGETSSLKRKWSLSNKPVVAVGAGATAAVGASSLSKVLPASTFIKVATFKVPASLKLFLTHTHKAMAMALGKTKVVAPGLATSGSNTSSILKAAASAEKIRTVAHSVIASLEKTSFSAMRTAFYEIMRKRQVQPIGVLPWATFGCSVATCTGLLVYGAGIECVAESIPAAPSIASLGRGIQNLHQASQVVRQTDGSRIQKSIETLMHGLKKVKIQ